MIECSEVDLFVNALDEKKFQYTNLPWNQLKLNSSWSVGFVTHLIQQVNFRSKEEWKEFYFQSGEDRNKKIAELDESIQKKLHSHYHARSVDEAYAELNTKMGRAREQLALKGAYLYQEIEKLGNPLGITEKECTYAVYYRVVCETWNGVMKREKNTTQELTKRLKEAGYDVEIRKVDGEFDYKYAVDFELFFNRKLIGGIQVKPDTYQGNKNYLVQARLINQNKNAKYVNTFEVPVWYVYYSRYELIKNRNIIDEMVEKIKERS